MASLSFRLDELNLTAKYKNVEDYKNMSSINYLNQHLELMYLLKI